MATGRRIFIGDVHGHYDGLLQLMESLAPGSDDEVYFLGDLIDRGPKSAQVVSFVRQSGYLCLLGNHEQMLLEAFPGDNRFSYQALQAWLYSGGQSTIASYSHSENLLTEHLQWVRSLPTHLDLGDIWLAHAGVHPDRAIADHTPQDYCWIRDEFHSMAKPYFADKLIITGHTITFTFPGVLPGHLVRGQGWIDIDTGAYHPRSGWLTAYDHTQQQVYQVNVFNQSTRVSPLDEVSIRIEPATVASRRRAALPNLTATNPTAAPPRAS